MLPWALRCARRDQERPVSVCAGMSVFVMNRERNCMCAMMHICKSACKFICLCSVYLCVYPFLKVFVGTWMQN